VRHRFFTLYLALLLTLCLAADVLWMRSIDFWIAGWSLHWLVPTSNPQVAYHHLLGFRYLRRGYYSGYMWEVGIPLWAIAVIVAAAPVCWILRRRSGHPAGHCVTCGYDLRASPDRCPECGTIAAKVVA
jgi:hypothetical protein